MNHSGVGKITSNYEMILSRDLLAPLGIEDGVRVWGMYYPDGDDNPYEKHDLVLSPIPYKDWGKTARLVVRTKHKAGVFEKFTGILKGFDISILTSEASRSANHYDTWSLIVCFEDIDDAGEYKEKIKSYQNTYEQIGKIRKKLEELVDQEKLVDENDRMFFIDEADEILKYPFIIMPHNAMSYFNNKNKLYKKRAQPKDIPIFSPEIFELTCVGGSRLVPVTGSQAFPSLMQQFEQHFENFSPAVVFAETNTLDRNIRLSIFPKYIQNRLFNIRFAYNRAWGEGTSKGVMNLFLQALPKTYNCWNLNTKIEDYTYNGEKGFVDIIIYDNSTDDSMLKQEERERVIGENLRKEQKNTRLPFLKGLEFSCTAIESAFNSDKHIDFNQSTQVIIDARYDVYISYTGEDIDKVYEVEELLKKANINYYMHKPDSELNEYALSMISSAIKNSKEVLIFYSKNSMKNACFHYETGLACILDKSIVTVYMDMKIDDVPLILKGNRSTIYYNKIDENWLYLKKQPLSDEDIIEVVE